jgi:ATP-dependent Clp protease ATP-binding subunit ClpC
LENFAPNARQALELAPEEARRFKHDFVGTEHLLLSLTRVPSGVVANVIGRLGLDSDSVRLEIEKLVSHGVATAGAAAEIPFTPRAKRALQLAADEASVFNQDQIRPEHVFLGLLLEGSGVAALVLKQLGVGIERAREEVLKEVRANPDAC